MKKLFNRLTTKIMIGEPNLKIGDSQAPEQKEKSQAPEKKRKKKREKPAFFKWLDKKIGIEKLEEHVAKKEIKNAKRFF